MTIKYHKDYDVHLKPYSKRYKRVKIDDKKISDIKTFTNEIIKKKVNEKHHKQDNRKEYKRFYTGTLGEIALENYLNKTFFDWTIGESSKYNSADLRSLGINVGIKTVEFGKFPIIHKNPKRPEIIMMKLSDNEVVVCGLATVETMKKHSSDKYIESPFLRKRGTKTGFYGFKELKPFKTIQELKNILLSDLHTA